MTGIAQFSYIGLTSLSSAGFGSEKVVLMDNLIKNNFVKDDTLKVQVKLKAGEIIKN